MAKKKAIKKNSRKKNPVLQEQYNNTAFLNNLASQILWPLREQANDTMVNTDYYRFLLRRFRRIPHHHGRRWLLIQSLQHLEVNPNYPLDKFGEFDVRVSVSKKQLLVHLEMRKHPTGKTRYHQADGYYFELILLAWNKKERAPDVVVNETDWIDKYLGLPSFDIPLNKPAGITHWLLFVHGLLGKKKKAIGAVDTRGLKCVWAGTFDKKDLIYQQEWMEEMKQAAKELQRVGKEKKEGVKAKEMK
jgi:hypothetical protein